MTALVDDNNNSSNSINIRNNYQVKRRNSSMSTLPLTPSSSLKQQPNKESRRRRLPFGSSSKQRSSDTQCMWHRHVHFSHAPPTVHMIEEHVLPEEEDLVWYPMNYLQATRREDIKNNLRAQYFSKPKDGSNSTGDISIESDSLTWRGLEDVLQQADRPHKVAQHVQAVCQRYQKQSHPLSAHAQSKLRHYARNLSRDDVQLALELASQDQCQALGKPIENSVQDNTHNKPLQSAWKATKSKVKSMTRWNSRRSHSPSPSHRMPNTKLLQ